MRPPRRSARFCIEPLERRALLSVSTAPLPGAVSKRAIYDLAFQQRYVRAFASKTGEKRYDPVVDLNHNGFVGIGDGKILLRHFQTVTPPLGQSFTIHILPNEQARPPISPNSGSETRLPRVTIVGRTIPGSLIFSDGGRNTFRFSGPAFATDARGFFKYRAKLDGALTVFNFLVLSPFREQQLVRQLPVRRMGD